MRISDWVQTCALPIWPDGVINDRDPLGEYPFAQRIQEEAGFAGNGCARHAADQMSDQAGADSGIEDDGHLPAFDLDRIEARNGALSGPYPDACRRLQIGAVPPRLPCVITLHAWSCAGG